MKNFEKYKTAQERENAFEEFCYEHSCSYCPIGKVVKIACSGSCGIYWLELEANDEETKEKSNELC